MTTSTGTARSLVVDFPPLKNPDLRTWLNTLESNNQLNRVKAEVDWDLELGAITRISMGLRGPALLFEAIKGYRDGLSTQYYTAGISNHEQMCLMAGIPAQSSMKEVVRLFKDRYRNGIPPVEVPGGPVKENILTGDGIDLWQLPTPRWHHRDGGRYIDTFCGVITRDLGTNQLNVGNYRGMVVGKNKIGKLMVMSSHWGNHFSHHREKKSRMPIAVVHGWHDVLPFCSASPFPKHVCEYDMMGAILRQPVELVKCETSDLMVPASAEMVIEGFVDPNPETFSMEGPFGEYPGYAGGSPSPKPTFEVTCITHRDNPIMQGALEGNRPGFPSIDYHLCAYSWSAIAWNMLEDAGVPGVTDVWMTPATAGTNVIVQIQKRYRGHAKQVASTLWGLQAAQWFFKNVIVVEEDIDIRDPEAVDWAIAWRVNASRGGIETFGPTFGSVLDPSTPHDMNMIATYGSGCWTRVCIDATRDWDLPRNPDWENRRFPPVDILEPELEEKIKERWKEYNLGLDYLSEEQREILTYRELSRTNPRYP